MTGGAVEIPSWQGRGLAEGEDLAILSFGRDGLSGAGGWVINLAKEGVEATVVNELFAKPLDSELIPPLAEKTGRIMTIEEGAPREALGARL